MALNVGIGQLLIVATELLRPLQEILQRRQTVSKINGELPCRHARGQLCIHVHDEKQIPLGITNKQSEATVNEAVFIRSGEGTGNEKDTEGGVIYTNCGKA